MTGTKTTGNKTTGNKTTGNKTTGNKTIPSSLGTEKPSWLFGTGASAIERLLVYVAAVVGVSAFVLHARLGLGEREPAEWSWWQYAVGVVIVFDLAGGVVALALDSAKRFYHSPLPAPRTAVRRFMHSRTGFTAAHVQPIVIGVAFDAEWWWGPLWYGWALAGVVLITRTPLHLARPAGFLVLLAGVMTTPMIPAPFAFAWLPTVLLLKLVAAHGVPEEPHARTAEPTRTAR